MNNQRQHFVPQAYLKNFCIRNTTNLFRTKFIEQKALWSNPKSVSTSSICYNFDFYDIHENTAKKNQINPDFIEKKIFWYEQDYISDLIMQLESEKIQENTISKIPEFYLNMISRNPLFREAFDIQEIDKILNQLVSDLMKKYPFINEQFIQSIAENLREEFLSEDGQDKIHNMGLLRQHQKESDIYKEIINKLQGYKIEILKITDDDNLFICSDAPGFSRDINNNIYSFKFKDDISHYLPMTSKITIGIHHPVYHFQKPKLQISACSLEYIEYINKGSAIARKNYLFCEDREYLISLTNRLINK